MSTERVRAKARLVLVAAAAVLALAVVAPTASAAHAKATRVTTTCWKDVVNDWLRHQPNLTGSYPIPCYTQAIQHLSAYPDIKQYSSAIDDISRARQAAIRYQQTHPGSHDGGTGTNPSGGAGPGPGGGGPSGSSGHPSSSGGGDHKGVFRRIASDIGPGNAQSIPLPLLVLGGLGLLLLLTAAATWFARRIQDRRVTPAPARARAGSSVRPEP